MSDCGVLGRIDGRFVNDRIIFGIYFVCLAAFLFRQRVPVAKHVKIAIEYGVNLIGMLISTSVLIT